MVTRFGSAYTDCEASMRKRKIVHYPGVHEPADGIGQRMTRWWVLAVLVTLATGCASSIVHETVGESASHRDSALTGIWQVQLVQCGDAAPMHSDARTIAVLRFSKNGMLVRYNGSSRIRSRYSTSDGFLTLRPRPGNQDTLLASKIAVRISRVMDRLEEPRPVHYVVSGQRLKLDIMNCRVTLDRTQSLPDITEPTGSGARTTPHA